MARRWPVTDYFETVNPATQEVLAEVAAGGEAEVDAAVAAAKATFPKWANTPATDRARLIRKLGDLIAKTCARDRPDRNQ
jgi:5-carboxymethyl-2-hydroxymuconic-semialdehyde dehydrogenase